MKAMNNGALTDHEKKERVYQTADRLGVVLGGHPSSTASASTSTVATGSGARRTSPNGAAAGGTSRERARSTPAGHGAAAAEGTVLNPSPKARPQSTSAQQRVTFNDKQQKPIETCRVTSGVCYLCARALLPGQPGRALAKNEQHAAKLWESFKNQKIPMAFIEPRQVKSIPRRLQAEIVFEVIGKTDDEDTANIPRGVLEQLGAEPGASSA